MTDGNDGRTPKVWFITGVSRGFGRERTIAASAATVWPLRHGGPRPSPTSPSGSAMRSCPCSSM